MNNTLINKLINIPKSWTHYECIWSTFRAYSYNVKLLYDDSRTQKFVHYVLTHFIHVQLNSIWAPPKALTILMNQIWQQRFRRKTRPIKTLLNIWDIFLQSSTWLVLSFVFHFWLIKSDYVYQSKYIYLSH